MLSQLKKKTPHRFYFEIIPKRCEGLHAAAPGAVSVVCESGSKISYTEPSPLSDEGTAEFSNVIRMTSTVYKQDHSLLPKEYNIKLQFIREAHARTFLDQQRRKTVARAKLNMAEFCSHSSTPAATEVVLPLQPQGSLRLIIRAVWLQQHQQPGAAYAAGETDNLTEYSSLTISSADNDTASMDSGSTGRGQALSSPSASNRLGLDSRMAARTAANPRRSSADMSSLVDYHLRVNSITVKQQAELARVVEEAIAEQQAEHEQQQRQIAGQQHKAAHQSTSDALTARTLHSARGGGANTGVLFGAQQAAQQQQQQQQGPGAVANSPASKGGGGGRRQRSSAPVASSQTAAALTQQIDPIIEADQEGHDCAPCGASTLDRTLSEEALKAHLQAVGSDNPFTAADSMVSSSPEPSARLYQLQQQQWAAGVRDGGLATPAAESTGPAGLRGLSGHFPGWRWPFSRDFVKGATTDELMRQIAASAKDAPKLQQLCRGLLVERNDWRYKATQWERQSQTLQEQVDALNNTKVMLVNQLMAAEGQLALLQKDALLDKLVEAKLQLAQSDLHAAELQGQLAREQDCSKQLQVRLTVLQSKYERLSSLQAAQQQQQQQHTMQAAGRISPFQDASTAGCDQEQGEGMMSPAVKGQTLASLRPGSISRSSNSAGSGGGWGWGQWMRGGSFVGGSSSCSG